MVAIVQVIIWILRLCGRVIPVALWLCAVAYIGIFLWLVLAGIVWSTTWMTATGEALFLSGILNMTEEGYTLAPTDWHIAGIIVGVSALAFGIHAAIYGSPSSSSQSLDYPDDPWSWYHD